MWRSKSRAEWDRKKEYLIRSLFEDNPVLSPIIEANESSSSIDFNYKDKSPLPELTIEVKPKPNDADEPEEVYDKLAMEMRYLYKKDFLGINSTGNNTGGSENSNDKIHDIAFIEHDTDVSKETEPRDSENSSFSTLTASKTFTVQVEVHSQVHENQEDLAYEELGLTNSKQFILQSEEDKMDVSNTEIEATESEAHASGYICSVSESSVGSSDVSKETEPRDSETSSFSTLTVSKTFTVQVEVHSQVHENQEDLAYEELGLTNSKQFILQSEEDTMDVSNTEIEATESEAHASGYICSVSESGVGSSDASPEILRQRKSFEWLGTPTLFLQSKSNSTTSQSIHMSMDLDNEVYEEIIKSDQEKEIIEGSPENESLMTPKPKQKKKKKISVIKRGHKKSLVSCSSSSSFKRVASVATQTSFSDSKRDYCCFWSKLFVGSPTVYNLCTK